jgi:hypothetical protein
MLLARKRTYKKLWGIIQKAKQVRSLYFEEKEITDKKKK